MSVRFLVSFQKRASCQMEKQHGKIHPTAGEVEGELHVVTGKKKEIHEKEMDAEKQE